MSSYRINSPAVIHQIFETEVVVVNLENGSYYSVEGAGIDIWRLLEQRCGREMIVAAFTRHANGSAETNETQVRAFLDEAVAEGLIVPEADAPSSGTTQPSLALAERIQSNPPRLHKFTDMRDLLLLDPIHELDEAGWPLRNQSLGR